MTAVEIRSEFHPVPTKAVFRDGVAHYFKWSWKGRWIELVPLEKSFGGQMALAGRLTKWNPL